MPNRMNGEIIGLFRRYIRNECTTAEFNEVIELFKNGEFELELTFVLNEELENTALSERMLLNTRNSEALLHKIEQTITHIEESKPKRRKLVPFLEKYSAAMFFILIGLLAVFLYRMPKDQAPKGKPEFITDIVSGKDKAYLTLANGMRVELKNENKSLINTLPNLSGANLEKGLLVYSSKQNEKELPVQYNTIEIPRAGQYQLQLEDGTKVWLNSETTLKYPTSFSSLKERKVELHGEAYFEVAHNKDVPFRVLANNQLLEVLGTEFNLNNYADEPGITTTLIAGKLKISSNLEHSDKLSQMIKPGQQSTFANNKIKVADVDTEAAIAWKNNDFIFKDEDFKAAMRKISRWYDVEIVYENTQPLNIKPGGWISRKNNISAVLEMIELTGKVHFKIIGRRIIVKT